MSMDCLMVQEAVDLLHHCLEDGELSLERTLERSLRKRERRSLMLGRFYGTAKFMTRQNKTSNQENGSTASKDAQPMGNGLSLFFALSPWSKRS